jgi:hypothetical protein
MTPQEHQLINDLFDRLASLENSPRDPEAERVIIGGLRRAPNAAYALVQTALVQDEALKRANAHIEELESRTQSPQAPSGSFLDSMRDTVLGQGQSHGSVPNVRPSETAASRGPVWNSGQVLNSGYADPRSTGYAPVSNYPGATTGSAGGSFLGTAAATAAGVIGGSLLMNSIRGLMGGNHQGFGDASAFSSGAESSASRNPWSGDQSSSDLARDAGLNDIGRSGPGDNDRQNNDRRAGLFDNASTDSTSTDDGSGNNDGFDSNDFGGGGGDSDYA